MTITAPAIAAPPITDLVAPDGRVIVKLSESERVLDNGIVLADQAVKNSLFGLVISSGVEEVNVGDTVVLSGPYAGANFDHDGERYVSLLSEELLAVIN